VVLEIFVVPVTFVPSWFIRNPSGRCGFI
jgi:hypothetical protein